MTNGLNKHASAGSIPQYPTLDEPQPGETVGTELSIRIAEFVARWCPDESADPTMAAELAKLILRAIAIGAELNART